MNVAMGSLLQTQLNFLDYALVLLWRRPYRNGGILLVFSFVVFLLASLQLTTSALLAASRQLLSAAPDITVQHLSAGRQTGLSAAHQDELTGIFGIRRIRARIWGYYFDEKNGANYTVIGLDMADLTDRQLPALAEGRLPQAAERGAVVLSAEVRAALGLGARQNFSLFRPDLTMASFKTVGTFAEGSGILTTDLILMSLADARQLFALPADQVTDLLVDVANPQEVDTIAAKITDMLPGSRVITRARIAKTYQAILGWRSGFGGVCLIASLAALMILAYDKASGLSQEDLREMAILRLIGWQAGDIILVRCWESSLIAMAAFIVGSSLAWGHVVFGQAALFQPMLLGWSVLRPLPELVPQVRFSDGLLVFSLSVLPYLCATIVPAWRSAMVRPEQAI